MFIYILWDQKITSLYTAVALVFQYGKLFLRGLASSSLLCSPFYVSNSLSRGATLSYCVFPQTHFPMEIFSLMHALAIWISRGAIFSFCVSPSTPLPRSSSLLFCILSNQLSRNVLLHYVLCLSSTPLSRQTISILRISLSCVLTQHSCTYMPWQFAHTSSISHDPNNIIGRSTNDIHR